MTAIPTAAGRSRPRLARLSLGVLPMLLLAACSSSPTAPSNSTSFDGVIASGTLTGALSFSVASSTLDVGRAPGTATAPVGIRPAFAVAPGDVTVTGTLKVSGGSNVALTGTYNTTTHALSLTGGGYSFTGTYANGRIDGTFTSPSGNGSFSAQPATNATISSYCGTYALNDGSDHGHFNIAVNASAGTLSGAWASDVNGDTGGLSGTTSNGAITVNVLNGGVSNGTVVSGTITATTLTGSFSGPDGTGSVSGGSCS